MNRKRKADNENGDPGSGRLMPEPGILTGTGVVFPLKLQNPVRIQIHLNKLVDRGRVKPDIINKYFRF